MSAKPLLDLYDRPGFMIRRAHQIAVAVFVAETASLGVTTTQYGILYLLKHRPNVDQITASRLLGLDRSTTGMVVMSLERAGYLARVVDKDENGLDLFARLETPAARAIERLLAPLEPAERPVFLRLLAKLTGAFNETSRVPLTET
jgi:DNA-binding MarR family transcriptional regulator